MNHWERSPASSGFNEVVNRQAGLGRWKEADIHVFVVLEQLGGFERAVAFRYCVSEIDLDIMSATDDGRTYWNLPVTLRKTNRDVNHR